MKKTLFAVAILLGVSGAATAQDAKGARPKKVAATTQTTTVQKAEKIESLKAEVITDEQIRNNKIKEKTEAKKRAKKVKASADIQN